jgi:hypothetical protein
MKLSLKIIGAPARLAAFSSREIVGHESSPWRRGGAG